MRATCENPAASISSAYRAIKYWTDRGNMVLWTWLAIFLT